MLWSDYYQKITKISKNVDKDNDKYTENVSQNRKLESTIRSFIVLGQRLSGISASVSVKEEVEPDIQKLQKLQAQINYYDKSSSREIRNLYCQASAQLNYIKNHADLFPGTSYAHSVDPISGYYEEYKSVLKKWYLDIKQIMSTQDEEFVLGYQLIKIPVPKSDPKRFLAEIKGVDGRPADCIGCPVQVPLKSSTQIGLLWDEVSQVKARQSLRYMLSIYLKNSRCCETPLAYINPRSNDIMTLGDLAALANGDLPLINTVILQGDAVEREVSSFGSRVLKLCKDPNIAAFAIVDGYPEAYSSSELAALKELVAISKQANLIVVFIGKISDNMRSQLRQVAPDAIGFCYLQNGDWIISASDTKEHFEPILLDKIGCELALKEIEDMRPKVDLDNRYALRVEHPYGKLHKGFRQLTNIPIGIDAHGQLTTMDLENERFATFLCGASRSGKSTLLHDILTGVFLSSHPDDVEVWLVDFKMTEFSRYVRNPVPHVRYIVLDESPELVFDLIKRLNEVLVKRQAIFKKNGWEKLSDVPSDRYMPELLVVIDEFHVMSRIVNEAAVDGNDCRDKLDTLFGKGAAFGFRFILSSQGFTTGTRGLTEYSKKQIQQRIAMKTDVAEIRETLGLRSASDYDRNLMEQLPVHYGLRKDVGEDGSSSGLDRFHALYFENEEAQESYLKSKLCPYNKKSTFESDNPAAYLDKKPVFLDGNIVKDFGDLDLESIPKEPGTLTLLHGEARRLEQSQPLVLNRAMRENALVVAPIEEDEGRYSVLTSCIKSAGEQDRNTIVFDLLASMRFANSFMNTNRKSVEVKTDGDSIANTLYQLWTKVIDRSPNPTLLIINNPRSIVDEINYLKASDRARNKSRLIQEKPRPTPSLLAMLDALDGKDGLDGVRKITNESSIYQQDYDQEQSEMPDFLEMLRDVLVIGPQCGVHTICSLSDLQDLRAIQINMDQFRHRLLFRLTKNQASSLCEGAEVRIVSSLAPGNYRYVNGYGGSTCRPYAHSDLGLMKNTIIDEDEFLL